ncbi:unnamed protein product, partial [marine sediment metagenome]
MDNCPTLPGGYLYFEKNTGLLVYGMVYYTGGLYNYTFELTDTNANFEISNQPPVVDFTFSPDKPIIGEKMKFNASKSYDPEGGELNYVWDFGDGNIKLGKIVENTYYIDGEHDVYLTVQDDIGQMITIQKKVTIVTEWTYAIITDLHIGRGYENYQREEYYLTERLRLAIQEIIDNKKLNNIKFVMVLGDLTESGKNAEFQ